MLTDKKGNEIHVGDHVKIGNATYHILGIGKDPSDEARKFVESSEIVTDEADMNLRIAIDRNTYKSSEMSPIKEWLDTEPEETMIVSFDENGNISYKKEVK